MIHAPVQNGDRSSPPEEPTEGRQDGSRYTDEAVLPHQTDAFDRMLRSFKQNEGWRMILESIEKAKTLLQEAKMLSEFAPRTLNRQYCTAWITDQPVLSWRN